MLTNEARARAQAGAALSIAAEEAGLPGRIAAALLPLLPPRADDAAAPGGRGKAGPEMSGPPETGKVDDRV